jgi:hypothetical protein
MPTVNPLLPTDRDRWFEPGPAWWRAVCATFDRVGVALAMTDTPAAVRLAGLLGRLARAGRLQGPSCEAVSLLFDQLPPPSALHVAREIAALRFKNRLATALVVRGHLDKLAAIVRSSAGVDQLQALAAAARPALVAAWHIGATFGVSAALHGVGLEALLLRDLPLADASARARALARAVEHIRHGHLLIATPDGPGGTSTGPTTCLNRIVALRRGPFMLARVTGVPVLPAAARWEPDGRISVEIGRPLVAPHDVTPRGAENLLANEAARWLDAYLRNRPQEVSAYILSNFLETPTAAA